jgi:hypothetical protein
MRARVADLSTGTTIDVSFSGLAIVAAVLLFPLTALTLLRGAEQRPEDLLEPAG